jgi:hypothetical protein
MLPKLGASCRRLCWTSFLSTFQGREYQSPATRPEIWNLVVQTFDEFSEMSEWLGQRYEDILKQSPGRSPRNLARFGCRVTCN